MTCGAPHWLALALLLLINLCARPASAHTFVSFDATRSSGTGSTGSAEVTGPLQSFALGGAYELARAAIQTMDQNAVFIAVPILTESSLSGDVFVSGLLAAGQDLSSTEQSALFNFVESGGAALIFGELETFLDASNSLVSPFGMTFEGSLFDGTTTATIIDAAHPIASGAFGVVATFHEAYVTSVGEVGVSGHSVATNPLGDTLVVIPRDALAPGSGPVVVYSDSSLFLYEALIENEVVFKNTVAYLILCDGDLDSDGSVGVSDLLLVLAQWGPCPPACFADVDGDNAVGILDLLLLLAQWGSCP